MTSNVQKETSRNTKMKIKNANLFNKVGFCIKTNGYIRNITVIQQSDRVYNVTFPAYNIDPKPGMSHYIPCLIAE